MPTGPIRRGRSPGGILRVYFTSKSHTSDGNQLVTKLRIGVPKGSLQDATFNLFKKAGWDFRVRGRSPASTKTHSCAIWTDLLSSARMSCREPPSISRR